MVQVAKEHDRYLADFERFAQGATRAPSWLHELRTAAISRFAALGFPTARHENVHLREEWKYTNVAPIAKVRFQPAADERNGLTANSWRPSPLGTWSAPSSCL